MTRITLVVVTFLTLSGCVLDDPYCSSAWQERAECMNATCNSHIGPAWNDADDTVCHCWATDGELGDPEDPCACNTGAHDRFIERCEAGEPVDVGCSELIADVWGRAESCAE